MSKMKYGTTVISFKKLKLIFYVFQIYLVMQILMKMRVQRPYLFTLSLLQYKPENRLDGVKVGDCGRGCLQVYDLLWTPSR